MDYLGFGYAAAVAVGGIIGYAKAGDTIIFISTLRCTLLWIGLQPGWIGWA